MNTNSKNIKNKNILKDTSFTLNSGDIIGLVGGNGAGKTTLMKVILGLSSYQSGTLKSHTSNKSNDIGALIKNPGLYSFLTGFENMKLVNEYKDKNSIQYIVDKLEMNDFIHNKEKTYSLGMKQKLGIALALLNHPKFVILDAPMNGLDPKAVKNVRETIIDFKNRSVTYLISSHILSELVKVRYSILIIDKGAIIKETTMEELKNSDENDLETLLLNIIDQKGEES